MQHFRSLENVNLQGTWLTIGSFDGIHRGHQEIIHQLTAEAHHHQALAVLLTFFPHPAEVLSGRNFPFYLTTPEEKAEILNELGVDVLITHPFNQEVAATSAHQFMTQLHQHLGMRHLKIGHDFALGRGRSGDALALSKIGKELGYSVAQIPAFRLDDQIVSSSQIRFLLGAGQVKEAAELLGRNFKIAGKIVVGDQRGRTIGFPTANLDIWKMRAIPASGVYVCQAWLNGIAHQAVTNIGVRPTFEDNPVPPRVEVHLLDFEGDIYGKNLQLEFLSRLRGEQRFDSPEELIRQIHRDVESAKLFFA